MNLAAAYRLLIAAFNITPDFYKPLPSGIDVGSNHLFMLWFSGHFYRLFPLPGTLSGNDPYKMCTAQGLLLRDQQAYEALELLLLPEWISALHC